MDSTKWKKLKKSLWISALAWTLLGTISSGFIWGVKAGIFTILGSFCLLAGFLITELLVGVFAGVKKANGTAIGLLFLGKLLWWASLFWLSRHLSVDVQLPLAIGMGAFLLSLVSAVLLQYGMPKISDATQQILDAISSSMILEGYREKTMLLDAELLKKTGIFGLVSGELIAFIGGGYWVGTLLDNRWNLSPVFTVLFSTIGLSYSVWRIHRLSKKWMEKKER